MHFNESHPQGMNHGPGVLIGKNVTLFLCTSWSWLMYCQFCPRRICMQRNASTIRGWGGGGGGGGHFKGFGGSNSSSSPSMTFHSSFNLLYMSLLLMTARPSISLLDGLQPSNDSDDAELIERQNLSVIVRVRAGKKLWNNKLNYKGRVAATARTWQLQNT